MRMKGTLNKTENGWVVKYWEQLEGGTYIHHKDNLKDLFVN